MAQCRLSRPLASLMAVTTALFTDGFVYGVVVPLTPHLPAKFDPSWTFGLFAGYAIGVAIATPCIGALADSFGRRRPLLVGSLAQLSTVVILATAGSFHTLFLARLAQGAAAAATWTAGLALVSDHYEVNRARMLGFAMLGGTCGLVIGPLAGGFLLEWQGYGAALGGAFVLVALDAIQRLFLLRDIDTRCRVRARLRPLLQDPAVRAACSVVILGAWCWSMLEALLPAYLEHNAAATPASVGLIFTVSSLVYGASCPMIGALSQRFGARRMMPAGLAVMGMAIPLLTLPRTVGGAGALLGVFGVAYGFAMNPSLSELGAAVDRQGSGAYASIYAVYNLAYSAGTVMSNVVTGALLSTFSLQAVLTITGIVLLSCLPASTFGGVVPLAASMPRGDES